MLIKIIFSMCLLFSIGTKAEDQKLVRKILDQADKLYRSKSSYSEVLMKIKTEHWQREMRLEMWTKGMEKTLIHILSPKKDSGISTLRIKKEMWNFFPKINKVIKVPPSMMMGSWMGSDFTNDDLVKTSTFLNDYKTKMISGPDSNKYYLELRPNENLSSVWDRILLVVNKKTLILEQQVNFDERGERVRTMDFSKAKNLGGKFIPTLMVITSHKKDGNQTILRYVKAEFDKSMKDSIFSRRNLQKRK